MPDMTPAEALGKSLDRDCYPADIIKRLRALGFAIVPVVPDDSTIDRGAHAIEGEMFAPHELPLDDELHGKFRATCAVAYTAMVAPDAEKESSNGG